MRCLLAFVIVLQIKQSSSAGTFRVALVSEFSGSFSGAASNFIEGFRDFSVPVINSIGGIPIAGVPYQIEVVEYDTQSNASRVAEVIAAVANGLAMDGTSVGDVHAIVAGTSKLNTAVFGPAETAGLVNIHTSGGNPTMWKEANTYAYGLHLPFIWYTRGPIKMAATRGAKTIAIIRSMAHGFSRASCIAAVQWALDAELTIVGPSVAWCNAAGAKSGGCSVVADQCVCGSQSDVNAFGLGYNIEKTPNFYQLDENLIGNGLLWRTVDANTTAFARSMIQDMLSQGPMPDIILNFATEWHNVLKALVLEDVTPKILLGWQDGVTAGWAQAPDASGNEALTAMHGYWAMGFGQWHKAMKFNDPVFKTNANVSQLFEAQRGRSLDYDTAGAITAGVVLYTAMSRHFDQSKVFGTLSLTQKRDAVKQSVGDINDETMWGSLRFNSKHQNIGRGTAAWQVIPDALKQPQQLCVLPSEAAETMISIPFPSWESRTGCSAGRYNSGSACELCPTGGANNQTTAGMEITNCTQCPAGSGTDAAGHLTCSMCSKGRSQDGDRDAGTCRNCTKGQYQNQMGTLSCEACLPGSYAHTPGQANCSSCSVGKFQNRPGQSECSSCRTGTFAEGVGQTECAMCPLGQFAPQIEMIVCNQCPVGFTTESIASDNSSRCVCPEGTFLDVGGSSCVKCKEGMTCPLGSNVANFLTDKPSPLLKKGFWSDPAGDKLSVYECEDAIKCPGGPPGTCTSLLEGRSCTRCMDRHEWNGQTCLSCSSVETSKFLYPILPLLIAPIILGCMYKLFSDSIPQWGSYGNGVATVTYLTLNHYQVIDLIGKATTRQNVPAIMQDSLEIWSWTNDIASILSPLCAGFTGFSAALVGQALLPFFILLIALSMYSISQVVAATAGNRNLALEKNRLFNVFMSLIFTFFTAIAALSLALFKCLDNPNGKKTVAADHSMVCGEDEWSAMLVVALFAIAVYVVGFASLLLWVIVTAISKIHEPQFQMRWKFLFIKFRFDAWWFAMTYLAKGLLYNLGFVVFTRSLEQLCWLMLITTIYLSAVIMFLPYRHRLTTIVDSMVCVSIIYCCALKMWFAPRVNDEMDHAVAVALAFVSFSPIVVSCAIGLWMAYLNKIGKSQDSRKVQKQCDDFCRSVITLAESDPDVLQSVFKEVSEIDRWHMTQTTKLFDGKRNLGMVGNNSLQSLELGQKKSLSLDRTDELPDSELGAAHEQDAQKDGGHEQAQSVEQPVDDTYKLEPASPSPPAVDHEQMHLAFKEAGQTTPPLCVSTPRCATTPREDNGPRTPR